MDDARGPPGPGALTAWHTEKFGDRGLRKCTPLLLIPCAKYRSLILSLMEQYQRQLNGIFQALSDPTRRAVVARLGSGSASVSELAAPFDMALPSFMKHIHMLEESGLIRTSKSGRVRVCEVDRTRLAAIDDWLSEQKAIWTGRTDRLERFVTQNKEQQE